MQSLFKKLAAFARAVFRRPLFIVLVTIAAIALMVITRPKLEPVNLAERVWPVEVVTVKAADHQPELKLFGEVVAGRRSEMRALVPGTIVEVGSGFREGARVSAGDLLVQIDPFEYQTNLAEQTALLKEAEANLKIKRRDLKRIRELFEEKNVSEQALDDAMLAVEQQEATLAQRRIGLERAQRALSDARLTAPYDGVVSGVSVDLGKRLSVNDKVADIIDTERLDVRFSLSNAQFGRIIGNGADVAGRTVEVNWEVGERTLTYQATVQRVGAEIDSTTGGVVLYANIEPEAKALLRPGAFVWIRMPDKTYEDVYRAPDSALYGENLVYVVKDQRMESRTIEVLGYAGDDILFRGTGEPAIADGDKVVTTQIREGGAGIKVEIRE